MRFPSSSSTAGHHTLLKALLMSSEITQIYFFSSLYSLILSRTLFSHRLLTNQRWIHFDFPTLCLYCIDDSIYAVLGVYPIGYPMQPLYPMQRRGKLVCSYWRSWCLFLLCWRGLSSPSFIPSKNALFLDWSLTACGLFGWYISWIISTEGHLGHGAIP